MDNFKQMMLVADLLGGCGIIRETSRGVSMVPQGRGISRETSRGVESRGEPQGAFSWCLSGRDTNWCLEFHKHYMGKSTGTFGYYINRHFHTTKTVFWDQHLFLEPHCKVVAWSRVVWGKLEQIAE